MDVITPTGRPTRIVLMMLYETMIKTLFAFGIFVYIIVICRLTSLVPLRCKFDVRYVIFKLILVIGSWNICCETALIWLLPDWTKENWTLVQLMASCGQAASHNSYQKLICSRSQKSRRYQIAPMMLCNSNIRTPQIPIEYCNKQLLVKIPNKIRFRWFDIISCS